jgi:hypothetical protein
LGTTVHALTAEEVLVLRQRWAARGDKKAVAMADRALAWLARSGTKQPVEADLPGEAAAASCAAWVGSRFA